MQEFQYARFGCHLNDLSVKDLFKAYETVGFVYPEKMAELKPYFDRIMENWELAIGAGLMRVVSYGNLRQHQWASLTSWLNTIDGLSVQHLVGVGGPVASRAVMLCEQESNISDPRVNSGRNFFQRKNRFANRIFGTIDRSLEPGEFFLHDYCYFSIPKARAFSFSQNCMSRELDIAEILEINTFLNANSCSAVYELDPISKENMRLSDVNRLYQTANLYRYRNIYIARKEDKIIGCAIAYRGPLGMNFSFLENRCELILASDLAEKDALTAAHALLNKAVTQYDKFEPDCIYVLTNPRYKVLLEQIGGRFLRTYTQGVWTRSGFRRWYRHVDSIYERVIHKHNRKRALSSPVNSSTYLMNDMREAERLSRKVDGDKWVEKYLKPYLSPDSKVLDVGCGPGHIASRVAPQVSSVVGVDLHPERFVNTKLSSNLTLKQGDVNNLPFEDNEFDITYIRFLLEYLTDKQGAVNEITRVTKPGGTILLQDLDGQLLWHYPIEDDLSGLFDEALAVLVTTGFDPFVGRKLFSYMLDVNAMNIHTQIEPYHVIAGTLNKVQREEWALKLDIAKRSLAKLKSDSFAERVCKEFMRYLESPQTLTYSNLFTVVGESP